MPYSTTQTPGRSTTPEAKAIFALGVLTPVLGPVIILGSILLTAIPRAIATKFLWNWFVAPLGAPPLTYAGALGVLLLVVVLTMRSVKLPDDSTYWGRVGAVWAGSALCLLVGWLVS